MTGLRYGGESGPGISAGTAALRGCATLRPMGCSKGGVKNADWRLGGQLSNQWAEYWAWGGLSLIWTVFSSSAISNVWPKV